METHVDHHQLDDPLQFSVIYTIIGVYDEGSSNCLCALGTVVFQQANPM